MATQGWRTAGPLTGQLRSDYTDFDYYQLLRLLLAERGSGAGRRAMDAGLRFGAELSAAFPGQEITGLVDDGAGKPIRIKTSNYCVAGIIGPMPEPFVEWLRARVRDGDRAMLDFFDLFNHRINTLRYALKACFNPGLNNARPEHTDNAAYLAAVMGLYQPGQADALPLPRRTLLAMAGLLGDRRRSAAMIERVLRLFTGVPVQVLQLRGGWAAIDTAQQIQLGRQNARLGGETPLGRRFWDPQGRIALRLTNLDHAAFCDLLPGGDRHDGLVALIRHVTDRQVDCVVTLGLAEDVLPPVRLTGDPARHGLRLGYTAWSCNLAPPDIARLFIRLHAALSAEQTDTAAEQRLCLALLLVLRLYGHAAAAVPGDRQASFLVTAYPVEAVRHG